MNRRFVIAALGWALALAACSGGTQPRGGADSVDTPDAVQTATAASTAATTAEPSPVVDFSELDACTLLDDETIRELTGTDLEFTTDQIEPEPTQSCFWGATTPVPPYVEIFVFPSDGLTDYTNNDQWDCTFVPVAGVGTEARGADCMSPGDQPKVYLQAREGGVAVRLLVNEPSRPLTPQDLGPTVAAVLEEILGT